MSGKHCGPSKGLLDLDAKIGEAMDDLQNGSIGTGAAGIADSISGFKDSIKSATGGILEKIEAAVPEIPEPKANLQEQLDASDLALQAANENNIELANENALLREQLDAAENKQLLRKTQDTQALAEERLLRKQQEDATKESRRTASSGSRRRGFYAGAVRNLERFATGASGYAARKRRERCIETVHAVGRE